VFTLMLKVAVPITLGQFQKREGAAVRGAVAVQGLEHPA